MNDIVILWFHDSPDAGTPECICSWCRKPIGEEEVPVRLFYKEEWLEARFHPACFEEYNE
jgi:hypothetical protein